MHWANHQSPSALDQRKHKTSPDSIMGIFLILFSSSNTESLGASIFSELPRCSCLQKLAKLLYHLEDLRYSHASGPSVDSILRGVQLAEVPWKCLMECSQCQHEDNYKESFLLFALSIRILLSSVQRLNSSSPRRTDGPSDIAVSVGSFELTGEAKAEVISMSIRRALEAITSALLHIWERTGRPRPLQIADLDRTVPRSSISFLTNTSKESQLPLSRSVLASTNLGAESITSLLDTLQNTMKSIEQELNSVHNGRL
ncbi:hypothetical protein F5B20DRAFT_431972 [Whalleya microplaca]|nr:hypothetical protein F5B20DRAFT_431972 [Whalleya microplaca]